MPQSNSASEGPCEFTIFSRTGQKYNATLAQNQCAKLRRSLKGGFKHEVQL
jgi:hypothetical protein